MRGLHLVLLAVLLCSDRALSLQCYHCPGVKTATQCHVMNCTEGQNVCFKGKEITTWPDGRKVTVLKGGCAPSCEAVYKNAEEVNSSGRDSSPLDNAFPHLGSLLPKTEVQGVSCCEKDLCNGVSRAGRSLWALAGGLLLSLGPALLWTLL
ncbi:lymphocyte antigen 6H-like [Phyllostomus hastatus]|uniref:lymphocyte antigen 6H-like n=1 Tax=Phyllostomus hastatus TaxID=9423 RepID=UPI001E68149F|nr:lymphocyte antigen 6H-like [Phyllostomus hastatus]